MESNNVSSVNSVSVPEGVLYTDTTANGLVNSVMKGVVNYENSAGTLYQTYSKLLAVSTTNSKLLEAVENFGNTVSAAGGIMSCITKNDAGQEIVTFNINNKSPYTISLTWAGGDGFKHCYVLECPDSIPPKSNGTFTFSQNHDYPDLSTVALEMGFAITDPVSGKGVLCKFRFAMLHDSDSSFGNTEIWVGESSTPLSLTDYDNDTGGALPYGGWFVGKDDHPSFSVISYAQDKTTTQLSIDFNAYL